MFVPPSTPTHSRPRVLSLQENVSCLNTSLVILMLARRKAKLPFYLNALREKEYAEKYPGCLLNNFHNLLRFWQRHYLNKDKDSTCLENVSGLSVGQAARRSGQPAARTDVI